MRAVIPRKTGDQRVLLRRGGQVIDACGDLADEDVIGRVGGLREQLAALLQQPLHLCHVRSSLHLCNPSCAAGHKEQDICVRVEGIACPVRWSLSQRK